MAETVETGVGAFLDVTDGQTPTSPRSVLTRILLQATAPPETDAGLETVPPTPTPPQIHQEFLSLSEPASFTGSVASVSSSEKMGELPSRGSSFTGALPPQRQSVSAREMQENELRALNEEIGRWREENERLKNEVRRTAENVPEWQRELEYYHTASGQISAALADAHQRLQSWQPACQQWISSTDVSRHKIHDIANMLSSLSALANAHKQRVGGLQST
eukprot:comp20953_c0_seq2/m.28020 comp20953_c0_seq2/g.28020  ORF comp20953_c0_seq2/g.28020 comp20953_c0_seq2/m.28020 type:complete len:219 (-) comp20953_c0_seq2:272-928(-)